jgi:hypothetical protein
MEVDIEKAVLCVWIDAENGPVIERVKLYYGCAGKRPMTISLAV